MYTKEGNLGISKACLGPYTMELSFAKIVNGGCKALTVFAKNFIKDVWQVSDYDCPSLVQS